MSENLQGNVSMPSWAVPVLLALAGGGAGFASRDIMSDEQPAVLAQGLDLLREDLRTQQSSHRALAQETRDAVDRGMVQVRRDVEGVRAELKQVSDLAQQGARDRHTRTDHQQWVQSVYEPEIRRLREEIAEHALSPGHAPALRRLDQLEDAK